MRRFFAALFRRLAEALVRLYYPTRVVEGRDRIPSGKPLVFVLNHPNGLLDPMVLRVATGWPARFLAKGTLFRNPISRLVMEAFGSIPIHRAQESGARAGDASRNDESFARCRAELAAGGAMALFPEGVSHSDPQLRPLKTGAARIALSAEAEHDGKLGVTLVPVGLYYERKALFRSSVLLVVGEPIAVAPLLADYKRDERQTVATLTEAIDARLDEVVLQAESRDLLAGIARVARWTSERSGDEDAEDSGAQHERARELAKAYARLRARDPARVEAIAVEVRDYTRVLRHLGVRDPWALELAPLRPGTLAVSFAKVIAAAPLAAIGAVMGWVPYRLAGEVATRVTSDDDVLGTTKLIAGTLFLWVAWGLEATAAGVAWGARWAVPVFVAGVATGYVALRFEELRREAAEAWRLVMLRAFHHQTTARLAERRRALAEAVARGLRDADAAA
ncbi:MAG TPA: lysophospholipid acyltransferase family protein [Polyangia bacterium]|nr:lysophospholipid acyltransferase family protein [Polyangia bacterium]